MILAILKHLRKNVSYSVRNLSYVEKCRYLKEIKGSGLECMRLIPHGKFLVYQGTQPFLKAVCKSEPNAEDALQHELIWLSFGDLCEHKSSIVSSHVMLGVGKDKSVRFGIQLGELSTDEEENFEKTHGGVFTDLRCAFFYLNWQNVRILSQAYALLQFHQNFAFCSRCGASTHRNAPGDSRSCHSCKAVFYPPVTPVGIVLVTDVSKEHALLVRQPMHPHGMFTCIAGFAEVGESLEENVRREVAEEVGLEVDCVNYIASQYWPFPGSFMAGCYAVVLQHEQLMIDSDELESARWFTRNEVSQAINKTQKYSLGSLRSHHPNEIFIPPHGSIAHHLIYHWFKRTPVEEVKKLITCTS